jgi:hypothetical protein
MGLGLKGNVKGIKPLSYTYPSRQTSFSFGNFNMQMTRIHQKCISGKIINLAQSLLIFVAPCQSNMSHCQWSNISLNVVMFFHHLIA